MNNQIEIILRDKIKDLGQFLISICDNEEKKQTIKETIIDIPSYKLLLFVSLLDPNRIDNQINDFINIFNINDTTENRSVLKDKLDYFIQVKNILDSK